jgi:PIN domain nuclease of toxin-antitoxin system
MRYLLDTHTLLWYGEAAPELPAETEQLLRDPASACYISRASLWEVAIKVSLKKLTLPLPFEIWQQQVQEAKFKLLEITD